MQQLMYVGVYCARCVGSATDPVISSQGPLNATIQRDVLQEVMLGAVA